MDDNRQKSACSTEIVFPGTSEFWMEIFLGFCVEWILLRFCGFVIPCGVDNVCHVQGIRGSKCFVELSIGTFKPYCKLNQHVNLYLHHDEL